MSGLHNADFKSSLGTLTIFLPSDMTVGETVSGTVNFKKYQIGIEENIGLSQFFKKYTINVENRPLDITGSRFILDVPVNLPTGVLAINLVDSSGRITNRAFFPVRLTRRGNQPQNVGGSANFRMPFSSRSGLPATITGDFDGLLDTSSVSISGRPAVLLAESKRQLVFMTPGDMQGSKVLALKERDVEIKNPFTVLSVVKIGESQPGVYASGEMDDTGSSYSTEDILVESGNETGKIDLSRVDLGDESYAKEPVSSTPEAYTELTRGGENTIGPSMSEISKPLEISPVDLPKERNEAAPDLQGKELKELDGLKQFSSESSPDEMKPVETETKSPVIAKSTPTTAGKDINEMKVSIEEQLGAKFTPLIEKSEASVVSESKPPKELTSKKEVAKAPAKTEPLPKETSSPPVKSDAEKPPDPKPYIKDEKAVKTSKKEEVKTFSPKKLAEPEMKVVKEQPEQQEMAKAPKKIEISSAKPSTKPDAKTEEPKKSEELNELTSLNEKATAKKKSPGQDAQEVEVLKEPDIKEQKFESLETPKAPPSVAKKETKSAALNTPATGKFAIQLASFKKESEASQVVNGLKSEGYNVYYKKFKVPGKGSWYRVRIGGFANRADAEKYKSTLKLSKYGISSFFVTPEE